MDYHKPMLKNDIMKTLGDRIKQARERAGFTQEEVAEEVGVSRTAVTRWEKGEIEPKLGNLIAVAEMLHVSSDYLLGVDENILPKELNISKKAEQALEEFVLEIRAEKNRNINRRF